MGVLEVLFLLMVIAALVCFVAAAFGFPGNVKVNLIALGLAFWVGISVIERLKAAM